PLHHRSRRRCSSTWTPKATPANGKFWLGYWTDEALELSTIPWHLPRRFPASFIAPRSQDEKARQHLCNSVCHVDRNLCHLPDTRARGRSVCEWAIRRGPAGL